jgi:SAM-dependent methyltransferase
MSRLNSQAEDDSREALDRQREQWQRALSERADRYGLEPSAPALAACERFEQTGARRLLELGGGQGRDSLFFAERGFAVTVLDYAPSAIETIAEKADRTGLAGRISVGEHDVRRPLPLPDGSFDGCYSHMLFCMALTEDELRHLSADIRRVLRPGGLCVYTACSDRAASVSTPRAPSRTPTTGGASTELRTCTSSMASSSTSSVATWLSASPTVSTWSRSRSSKKERYRDDSSG